MATTALYRFATLHNIPIDTPGRRRPAVDLFDGDVLQDPDNAAFLPLFVWVEGAYTLREETRVMVVRPVLETGHLGDRMIRELPVTTVVTTWEGPIPEAVAGH